MRSVRVLWKVGEMLEDLGVGGEFYVVEGKV